MSLIEKWKKEGYEAYEEGNFWTHLGTVESDLRKVIEEIDMGACNCPERELIESHIEMDREKLKQKIFGSEKKNMAKAMNESWKELDEETKEKVIRQK